MKIGIYGGTFDPIHEGHISVARAVKQKLGLDKVFFVVAKDPPHKAAVGRTPGSIRFELVRAALEKEGGMTASDVELKRGGISYTVETLRQFKREFSRSRLYFIVGQDMLIDFPTWRSPEEILRLAAVVAVHRPGEALQMSEAAERIESKYGIRPLLTDIYGPDVSSTSIRKRIFDAKPILGLTPLAAELLIYEKMLYLPDELRRIGARLAKGLDEYRLRHTMLVMREAILLADRYGVDTKKARLAALLHDCVKFDDARTFEYARSRGIKFTDEELDNPFLIHARLGAVAAEKDYGIDDIEILNAIRRHTTGCEEMTDLDKIIYLADKLEPTRNYRKLSSLRTLAYEELNAATAATMRHGISYTLSCGKKVHPITLRAIEELEKKL